MEIPEILEAFKVYDKVYKREYVDAALELREEITPHLIRILENLLADPVPYLENDYFDHIYAVILLGHFRERRAHETIVNVFSMPYETTSQLFETIIAKDLPIILLRTCHGSLEKIRSLVMNQEAYDYCRVSALKAMVYAVIEGIANREEILDFFGSLFTGQEAKSDFAFRSFLARSIYDLYPEELMPVIEKAYQDGLIETFVITHEDFEDTLKQGKEASLERTKRELRYRTDENVHKQMEWWACFESEQQSRGTFAPANTRLGKRKVEKKKKRKMTKMSRRKNRR